MMRIRRGDAGSSCGMSLPADSSASAGEEEGGQSDDELAPAVGPLAVGLDAPAVHLHELADQGQADAQPPLRSVERAIDLDEQVEDAGDHLGADADPVVADAEDDLVGLACHLQADAAAFLGVLRGVVEQVGEHLGEPDQVGVDVDRIATAA